MTETVQLPVVAAAMILAVLVVAVALRLRSRRGPGAAVADPSEATTEDLAISHGTGERAPDAPTMAYAVGRATAAGQVDPDQEHDADVDRGAPAADAGSGRPAVALGRLVAEPAAEAGSVRDARGDTADDLPASALPPDGWPASEPSAAGGGRASGTEEPVDAAGAHASQPGGEDTALADHVHGPAREITGSGTGAAETTDPAAGAHSPVPPAVDGSSHDHVAAGTEHAAEPPGRPRALVPTADDGSRIGPDETPAQDEETSAGAHALLQPDGDGSRSEDVEPLTGAQAMAEDAAEPLAGAVEDTEPAPATPPAGFVAVTPPRAAHQPDPIPAQREPVEVPPSAETPPSGMVAVPPTGGWPESVTVVPEQPAPVEDAELPEPPAAPPAPHSADPALSALDSWVAPSGVGALAADVLGQSLRRDGPFDGSVLPLAPGGPASDPGYPIKAHTGTRRFYRPESPFYLRTMADLWFRTPEDAERAGFSG